MVDIHSMISESREYFYTGVTRDVGFRVFQLKLLRKIVKDYEAQLIQALYQDLHKSPFESYATEISLIYEEIDLFIKQLPKWSKPEKVKTSMTHFPAESTILKEPRGVSLIVSSWNYPVNLVFMPLIGAIGAGNCVVIKPSEYTPHVAEVINNMIGEHFKSEYIRVILGDSTVGTALTASKFDQIFFTGSVAVGRLVMRAASEHLVPVTLELGGKSPCIVDDSANLEVAAKRIVWGKLMNAGQTGVAPDYLLVHHAVKDELVHRMVEVIQSFYGPDYKTSKDYPRIITEKHTERLSRYLEDSNVIYGGAFDVKERYFSPTLLDQVNENSPVMEEEIFGPILPIISFKAIDEVIQFVRSRPNPLALYIFSEKEEVQTQITETLSFGGGCINDTISHVANNHMPFGGIGESGIGSYHGYRSFLTFSHEKSLLKKGMKVDLSLKYPPYNTTKLKALKQFNK